VVIDLALAESIEVEVRPCREEELLQFDEIIMLGTGVEIVPITSVNKQKIRHGYVGPVTRQLQRAFENLKSAAGKADKEAERGLIPK